MDCKISVSILLIDPAVDLQTIPGLLIKAREAGVYCADVTSEGCAALTRMEVEGRVSLGISNVEQIQV